MLEIIMPTKFVLFKVRFGWGELQPGSLPSAVPLVRKTCTGIHNSRRYFTVATATD
jgi:hypothetical protein